MTASYDWYFDALAGKHPQIVQGEPQPGFYRMHDNRVPHLVPVAIWMEDDLNGMPHLVALVGDDYEPAVDVWMSVAGHPIKEEYYREFMANGKWPDDPGPWKASNAPTKREELSDQIDSAVAIELKPIVDEATRDAAQALRSRLLELRLTADKEREKLKRPHLDANKAIDSEWQPMIKRADTTADTIRKAISVYETDQLNKRKAEEEAAREQPSLAIEPPSQETRIKGAYGRAASRKIKLVATVTDIKAAVAHYIDRNEILYVVQAMAQKDTDAGLLVPGIKVIEEVEVR